MMSKVAAVLAVMVMCLSAQEQQPPPKETSSKIVEPKYLGGARGERAAYVLEALLGRSNIDARFEPTLNLFVLRGAPDAVAAAEKAIARLDQLAAGTQTKGSPALAQIFVNVYVVEASGEPGKDEPIPQAIQSAVAQLRNTFSYKSYRPLDTILMNTMFDKGADVSGLWQQVPGLPQGQPITYRFSFESALVPESDSSTVILKGFRSNLRMPFANAGGFGFSDVGINTNVTVRPNQKLVLGKMAAPDPKSSLFLILTARVE